MFLQSVNYKYGGGLCYTGAKDLFCYFVYCYRFKQPASNKIICLRMVEKMIGPDWSAGELVWEEGK